MSQKSKKASGKKISAKNQLISLAKKIKTSKLAQELEGQFIQYRKSVMDLKKKLPFLSQLKTTNPKSKQFNRLLTKISDNTSLEKLKAYGIDVLIPQIRKLSTRLQDKLDLPRTADITELNRKIAALDEKLAALLNGGSRPARPANTTAEKPKATEIKIDRPANPPSH